MNTRARLAALVEGLYNNTKSGSIEWKLTNSSGLFTTSVGHNNIFITSDTSTFDDNILITIQRSDDILVDSISDSYLSGLKPVSGLASNYTDIMSDLFDLARRSATGADKVVDEILQSLNAKELVSKIGEAMQRRALPSSSFGELDDDVPF